MAMPASTDGLDEFFNVVRHSTLPLPGLEVAALLVILSACLLFRFTRIGLVTAYIFSYRWGWMVLAEQHDPQYLVGYMVFGMMAGIVAVIGMLHSSSGT
jgi:hypothetical protein